MPGTRLNETERRLRDSWNTNRFGAFPRLKSISIQAPTGRGLRGIHDLRVDFAFPVTFLSGRNGCGKSTLLSLAALAFHGVRGHIPSSSRRRAGTGADEFGYYTFQDFFYRGPGDSDVSGVQISWEFIGAPLVSLSKKSDKWMHYERRPPRPVEFLGLSRAIPAIELPALRNQFGLTATPRVAPVTEEARAQLQRALNRPYPTAEVLTGARYAIRRSSSANGYTSFNMGTGEDALIGLFARLQEIPEGALVVIEELEAGLHPAAQQRVAQALVEIALRRRLQIVGSTHSHHILDQLPREARILVIRDGDSHRVFSSPSAQFALSEMAGTSECELLVLCEDSFAASLVQQMLPKSLRRRVAVKNCGGKTQLALQAQSHLRLVERAKCLIVWDGDVSETEAAGYVAAAKATFPHPSAHRRLSWTRLPGGACPERWALEIAKTIGLQRITSHFRFDSDAEAATALACCGHSDPHSIIYELAQQVNLPEETVADGLAACAALGDDESSEAFANIVQSILDGNIVAGANPAREVGGS